MVRLPASTRMKRDGGNENRGRDLAASAIPVLSANRATVTPPNPSTSTKKIAESKQPSLASARESNLPPSRIPRKRMPQARISHAISPEPPSPASLTSLSKMSVDDAPVAQHMDIYNIPSNGSVQEYYRGQFNVTSSTQPPRPGSTNCEGVHIFGLPNAYTERDVAGLVKDYGGKVRGEIIMHREGVKGSSATLRLESPGQARLVRDCLNGGQIAGRRIEVSYEVDSALRYPVKDLISTSSSQTTLSSTTSNTGAAANKVKVEALLNRANIKASSSKSTANQDKPQWIHMEHILEDVDQDTFEYVMERLGADFIPMPDYRNSKNLRRPMKARFPSEKDDIAAVKHLPEMGVDGRPISAWLI